MRYWFLHRIPLRWLSRKLSRHQFMVIAGILVGITAGFAAVVLKTVVHYLNVVVTYPYPVSPIIQPYLYLIFPALGILITVWVVRVFFKGKEGKGLASVLYDIANRYSIVDKVKMYSQLITSSITVGLGGSSGLEGPIAVTGSAIGSNFGRVYDLNYRDRTLLLAAGAAGGIAGVFNAPITGVMFAVEVILAGVAIIEFIPLILASVCGTLFSQIVLNEHILFSFRHRQAFDYHNIPFYIVLGLICGLASLYYSYLVLLVERFFKHVKLGVYSKAMIGGAVLVTLCLVLPPLFGEGYSSVRHLADDEPLLLFDNSIWDGFVQHQEWLLLALIGLICVVKAVATSVTIHSGGNGGNFAPSLFVGAHVGYLFVRLVNSTGWFKLPVSNFTLVGMSGILSGVLYAPITAIFLIAEITGGYDLIVPLMIVSSIAYFFVRQVEPYSMETRRMAGKGEILTADRDANVLGFIRLEECIDRSAGQIHPEASLGELVELIRTSQRNIFAVIDEEEHMLGVILLDDIRQLMFDHSQYTTLNVAKIMRDPPAVVEVNEPMKSVMKKFDQTDSWSLPVTDSGRFVGFLSKSAILSVYREQLIRQSDQPS